MWTTCPRLLSNSNSISVAPPRHRQGGVEKSRRTYLLMTGLQPTSLGCLASLCSTTMLSAAHLEQLDRRAPHDNCTYCTPGHRPTLTWGINPQMSDTDRVTGTYLEQLDVILHPRDRRIKVPQVSTAYNKNWHVDHTVVAGLLKLPAP